MPVQQVQTFLTKEVTWQDDPGHVHRVLWLRMDKGLEPASDPTQPRGRRDVTCTDPATKIVCGHRFVMPRA